MEWNEDDGDLYNDDGTLKTDSFEINTIVRVYTGESYTIPPFMYAYTNNNINYFDGKTNKYVVAWGKNNENIIYATYEIITTSLQSEDGFIIVEGEFLPNTTLSVVQNGDNYTLKFFNGTTEVFYDNIVVKVKNLDKHIYICNGSEKEAVEHTTYGEYQRFELANSSTQFLLVSSESGLPNYAYVLIGVCSTLVLTLVVTGVVIIVRKKKNKKNN